METNDELLTLKEAAALLGITTRQLRNKVKQSHLLPVRKGGNTWFLKSDVMTLLETRVRRFNTTTTAAFAIQAHCLSRSLATRFEELCKYLGLDGCLPPIEQDEVVALHVKTQDTFRIGAVPTAEELKEWASIFNSIDESYLRLAAEFCRDEEPWNPYMKLAAFFKESAYSQRVKQDPAYGFAYGCLDASTRHLRHVAYFYIRNKLGARAANDLFEEGVDEEIISHIYPDTGENANNNLE